MSRRKLNFNIGGHRPLCFAYCDGDGDCDCDCDSDDDSGMLAWAVHLHGHGHLPFVISN
jgi:hypothetical protein